MRRRYCFQNNIYTALNAQYVVYDTTIIERYRGHSKTGREERPTHWEIIIYKWVTEGQSCKNMPPQRGPHLHEF